MDLSFVCKAIKIRSFKAFFIHELDHLGVPAFRLQLTCCPLHLIKTLSVVTELKSHVTVSRKATTNPVHFIKFTSRPLM